MHVQFSACCLVQMHRWTIHDVWLTADSVLPAKGAYIRTEALAEVAAAVLKEILFL